MTGVKKILLSKDALRCTFLLFAVAECMLYGFYRIDKIISPYTTSIIVIWGLSLLIKDFLGKRELFEMKNVWLLIAVLVIAEITVLLNPDYLNLNIRVYLLTIVYLLVVCPPDKPVDEKDKCKAIFAFSLIFILIISAFSTASLWSYLVQFSVESDERVIGYKGGSRLSGFYSNENFATDVSMVAIALLVVVWTLIKKIFSKPGVIRAWKITVSVLLFVNFSMLTLTDSRGARLGLVFFVLIFSFLATYKLLPDRIATLTKRIFLSILAAVILAGTTYAIDQPLRISWAAAKTLIAGESIQEISSNVVGRNQDLFTDTGRLEIWRLGLEMTKQYPLFGTSYAAIGEKSLEVDNSRPEEARIMDGNGRGLRSMHNAYLDIAVVYGIPMLLLFLIFMILYAKHNLTVLFIKIKSDNYLTAGAFLALCAGHAVSGMFGTIIFPIADFYPYIVVFWASMSFIASLLQLPDTSNEVIKEIIKPM